MLVTMLVALVPGAGLGLVAMVAPWWALAAVAGALTGVCCGVVSFLTGRIRVLQLSNGRLRENYAELVERLRDHVWQGDLAGFQVMQDDVARLWLTHRCGYELRLHDGSAYLGNLMPLVRAHRQAGCIVRAAS